MSITDQYLNLLGKPVRDKVRGMAGVVTSICFDLYGCVQAAIAAPMDKDGKLPDVIWHDVQRLEITGETIMPSPDFKQQLLQAGPAGAAEKPAARG